MKRLALLLPFVCLLVSAQSPPAPGSLISATITLNDALYVGKPCTIYSQNYQNPLTGHLITCLNVGGNFNVSVVGAYGVLNTGGGGGAPGGATGALQYNLGGVFAGLGLGTNITVYHGNASGVGAFGSVVLTSDVSGLLPITSGGTGTATPGLVGGTNVTITGSWPNQTINSSGGGSSAFSAITAGTNTGQALVVGAGSSLSATGTGQIFGNFMNRSAFSGLSGTVDGQVSLITNNLTGTLCSATSKLCALISGVWYEVAAPSGGGGSGLVYTGTLAGIPACNVGNTGLAFLTDQPVLQQIYTCSNITGSYAWSQGPVNFDVTLVNNSGVLGVNTAAFPQKGGTETISGNWTCAGTCTGFGGGVTKAWVGSSNSTNITIVNNSPTDISWDTNNSDNTGSAVNHSTSSNAERFIAATAGYYHGYVNFHFTTALAGNFLKVTVVKHSGSDITIANPVSGQPVSGSESGIAVPFSTHLGIGDYIKVDIYQNSGASIVADTDSQIVVEN